MPLNEYAWSVSFEPVTAVSQACSHSLCDIYMHGLVVQNVVLLLFVTWSRSIGYRALEVE